MHLEDEQKPLRSHQSSLAWSSSDDEESSLQDQYVTYGTLKADAIPSVIHRQAESPPDDANAPEIDPELRRKVMYAVPALAIGIFLASADQTIVVSSYGRIGSEMKALHKASWIATSYLLTQTSFQPLYGKLVDIFGRRSTLLFAFALFGLGTLLCGLARTMNELIAARAVAGIGGGGMATLVSILLSDVIPLPERGTWQGYGNIVFAAGLGFGATFGGFFADHIGWRMSFIGQVPLTAIGFLNIWYALDPPEKGSSRWAENLRRVDFAGALILISAVSSLLIGLHEGANVAWQSPRALGCLCACLPLSALFLLVELKVAPEPFISRKIIFDRTVLACSLSNFFAYGTWLAMTYYLPLYWQAVEQLSAGEASVRLLPGIVAHVTGSLFAGAVMQKTGKYYWLTVICYTTFALGVIPIILCTGWMSRSIWGIWAGTIICGFSHGIGGTSSLVALSTSPLVGTEGKADRDHSVAHTGRENQAVGIAILYLFRSLGSVIGISLSAAVIQHVLREQVREAFRNHLDVESILRHVRTSLEYIDTLDPQTQGIIRFCYEQATRWSFFLDLFMVVGAIGLGVLICEKPLHK